MLFPSVAAALDDLHRSGRPVRIPKEARDWVIGLALKSPRDIAGAPDRESWTITTLVNFVRGHCLEQGHPSLANVQRSSIWKWLKRRKDA